MMRARNIKPRISDPRPARISFRVAEILRSRADLARGPALAELHVVSMAASAAHQSLRDIWDFHGWVRQ